MRTRFRTSDLYLSSAINMLSVIKPDLTVEKGRVFFEFDDDPAVAKAVESYHRCESLPALPYASTIKKLRGGMYDAKNGCKR